MINIFFPKQSEEMQKCEKPHVSHLTVLVSLFKFLTLKSAHMAAFPEVFRRSHTAEKLFYGILMDPSSLTTFILTPKTLEILFWISSQSLVLNTLE